jgi:hypothetical protein
MPRKKVNESTDIAPTPEEATAKKPARRTTKKKAEEAPVPAQEAAQPAAAPITKKPLFGKPKPEKPASPPAKEEPAPVEQPAADSKPARSRRGKKAEAPTEEVAAKAEPVEAKTEAPKSRSRRRKKDVEPQGEAPTPAAKAPDDWDDDLPMPIWRPREPKATPNGAPTIGEAEQTGIAPRKSRRGRKKDQSPAEPPAAAAVLVNEEPHPDARSRRDREPRDGRTRRARGTNREQAREEAPVKEAVPQGPPPKPLIPVPQDAPQVVLKDGVPVLVRDGRIYPPFSFFGHSADERRTANVVDQIKMAGEAGVHIHSHYLEFEVDLEAVDTNVALAAFLLAKTLEVDPDAQVIYRITFTATTGWHEKFPDAKYLLSDGKLAEPSVSDDVFWGVARECLQKFVRKLRLLESSDHVLGVHLERGEWFYAEGWGYDTSRAAQAQFREWARTRYLNDIVALRAAWFDGQAQFQNLTIPEYQTAHVEGEKFVRSGRQERRWVDYHLFLSDATVRRIGDLAYAVKEASEGYFLVGVSYGYTFEWSHPANGHLSLGKLLRTPEIDFIAGPPSYRNREPGGAAPFPGPVDSFALNGKLYISEEDFKTSIGGRSEPDDFNPVIKTPQALESVHWRGLGSAMAHASGISWMDLWGNGWLKTPVIWERAAEIRDSLIRRLDCPVSDPDVAVFIDERALAYLVDQRAFTYLVQNVRESVLRAGLNAGFYLLSDLAHRESFPEAKLYVFLNAWDIRPELRAAIKTRLQRDNKVLFWLYAAGLFDSGREALERAREVTGIALKPQPFFSKSGTTLLNRRHILSEAFNDRGLVSATKLEPSYFAIPEEAIVLGEYSQTGLPSFVVKEFSGEGEPGMSWKSVFLGEPLVTPSLLRALGQFAGAHIWNFHDDVVHVRPPFLTVHCTGTGPRAITLPGRWAGYDVLRSEWTAADSTHLRFNAIDGMTYSFLVGPKEELEVLLSRSPEDALRMEELPTKPDDTIRFDTMTFDVPIMKLGEFIEGAVPDEVSEEWLLRPQLVEEPDGASEKVGRRRRRRGRRGGGETEPAEETASARRDATEEQSFDDLGMSVMFRKRD